MHTRRQRNEMLTILSEKKRRHFYQQFLGETRPVLFEKSTEPGRMSGFTDNYVRMDLALDEAAINTIQPVLLSTVNAAGLVEVLENEAVRG
jgi:threonylcarbamoyladenosine tRNA methylthiotransferase MtaB